MQKGFAQPVILIIGVILAAIIAGFLLSQNKLPFSNSSKEQPKEQISPQKKVTITPKPDQPSSTSSSPKGVVIVQKPTKGEKITSPLTISGFVYGNNGTLTIKLKQRIGGSYVTEDKIVKIQGKSDNISFAEAIQFGLPVEPQTGILEVIFKDNSGKSLDDKVEIEVEFPSDLGKGD
ncbi:hypothetical protein HYW46_00015 [Candidatus Daviesbacteria bacterium]|nr:hypothetical protein [Candidatus Daviesbacteria bacterium]